MMETYFRQIASFLDRSTAPGEQWTASLAAEESDFVRFNRGRVRQPGSVTQRFLELDWIRGRRHATWQLALTGDPAADEAAIAVAIGQLRAAIDDAVDDPHLLIATDVCPTREIRGDGLPEAGEIVEAVLAAADGTDLVGIYAGGPVYRGFANSLGQRNWHQATTFNLEWSLYHRADKAIKSTLSGLAWDRAAFDAKMAAARRQLADIARPTKSLPPGSYRAYLAPAAMEEIATLLCWDGFSGRAMETRQSPLVKMLGADGLRLDPRVTLAEAIADGLAPAFQGQGFVRPARTALIDGGRLVGALTSPRTEREFGTPANGANAQEVPEALAMAGGELPMDDALAALDRGLCIGNLWYLNYSDRPACRMTGMTRFATFWVEDGRIVAPIDVLRFDDTIYRMLGSNLEALTRETELAQDNSAYRERQLTSLRLPGVLLREMTFTL
jgi:predicted Zn-dependent protease